MIAEGLAERVTPDVLTTHKYLVDIRLTAGYVVLRGCWCDSFTLSLIPGSHSGWKGHTYQNWRHYKRAFNSLETVDVSNGLFATRRRP